MAELKKLICKRKTIRARVTNSHNRINNYPSLTEVQRAVERANLLDYKADLKSLNNDIQALKDTATNAEMEDEMESCENYRGKLHDCIIHLDSLISQKQTVTKQEEVDTARSLLKQPTAPLPTFAFSTVQLTFCKVGLHFV